MRHRKNRKHFNRTGSHKTAMMKNMAVSLLEHELIKTTLPKAKELRRVVEPLITIAKKKDSVANRRLAFSRLRDKAAVGKLFSDIGPRFTNRPGGYTRILKCGFRAGDKAPMAYVELVERVIPTVSLPAELAESMEQAIPAPAIEAEAITAPAEETPAKATEEKKTTSQAPEEATQTDAEKTAAPEAKTDATDSDK